MDNGRILGVIKVAPPVTPAWSTGRWLTYRAKESEVSFPVLEHIHIHKTSALMASAVRCGAILGNAGEAELESLTRYATSVGLAFQIADDILGVERRRRTRQTCPGSDEKRKRRLILR